jgi:hypothetical protein
MFQRNIKTPRQKTGQESQDITALSSDNSFYLARYADKTNVIIYMRAPGAASLIHKSDKISGGSEAWKYDVYRGLLWRYTLEFSMRQGWGHMETGSKIILMS